jgi:hypothetical protein
VCSNSQEVGLEAAILQRVRNSSLVEWTGTDNVRRLKQGAEAVKPALLKEERVGRGAFSWAGKPDRKDWWSWEKCECRNE